MQSKCAPIRSTETLRLSRHLHSEVAESQPIPGKGWRWTIAKTRMSQTASSRDSSCLLIQRVLSVSLSEAVRPLRRARVSGRRQRDPRESGSKLAAIDSGKRLSLTDL